MDLVILKLISATRMTPEVTLRSPNYHTTPTAGCLSLDRFNVQGGSSVVRVLETVIFWSRVRDHKEGQIPALNVNVAVGCYVFAISAFHKTEEKMELREKREYYRALILFDFNAGLNKEECVQRLQLAFGYKSPCRATVFRWFKVFFSGRNSLQDEEHTGRSRPAVTPDNVSAIRKMLMDDNRCTFQIVHKELNFGSAAI
ncbi:histone-lysine N-methyltransferase SETMAR [Trichonephila clavipes]|nr:histone-lysine N-methyltransferase SETMAR [Trichonephila clavipes]